MGRNRVGGFALAIPSAWAFARTLGPRHHLVLRIGVGCHNGVRSKRPQGCGCIGAPTPWSFALRRISTICARPLATEPTEVHEEAPARYDSRSRPRLEISHLCGGSVRRGSARSVVLRCSRPIRRRTRGRDRCCDTRKFRSSQRSSSRARAGGRKRGRRPSRIRCCRCAEGNDLRIAEPGGFADRQWFPDVVAQSGLGRFAAAR